MQSEAQVQLHILVLISKVACHMHMNLQRAVMLRNVAQTEYEAQLSTQAAPLTYQTSKVAMDCCQACQQILLNLGSNQH